MTQKQKSLINTENQQKTGTFYVKRIHVHTPTLKCHRGLRDIFLCEERFEKNSENFHLGCGFLSQYFFQ